MQFLRWFWTIGICFCGSVPAEAELKRFEFEQLHMGVQFKILLYAPGEAVANKAAEAAFRRVAELNRVMSDYDPDSELMQLTAQSRPGRPVMISKDLYTVLAHALSVAGQTGGSFDPTVGPVVKLWRRARRRGELPDDERLRAARALVGYRHVKLKHCRKSVEFLREGIKLDLGGIAKGFAADEALAELRRHGVTRALVDGSGDLVAGDAPPHSCGWRIGVAPLEGADGPPTRYLRLHNAAVATSGDAFQFVEIDGVRYSHIVDPHTGLGLTRRMSVTVVAPDGITADSLASAVSVLGRCRGLQLIMQMARTEAVFVEAGDDQTKVQVSPGFHCYEISTASGE